MSGVVSGLVVLGVDPGCPGGWAMLDRDGAAIGCGLGEVEDGFLSPTMIGVLAQHTFPPARVVHPAFRQDLAAAIESFPPRPMMHVKSIAGLFAGVGAWRIAIRAAGFPAPAAVDPKSWQHRFKDEYREAEAKLRARFPDLAGKRLRDKIQEEHRAVYHAEALRRWPDQRPNLVGPKGGKRHDAAAALWIAEHHRLSIVGDLRHAPRA